MIEQMHQELVDAGHKIKISCAPGERKWRVRIWPYWQGGRRSYDRRNNASSIEGIGKTQLEATENLLEKIKDLEV